MLEPKPRKVNERSDFLIEDDAAHELPRTLRAGVVAMRQAAREYKYMMPNPGELKTVPIGKNNSEVTLYEIRVQRSDLPDVWGDSIRAIASLPFRRRIVLEGWDEELMGRTEEDGTKIPGWVDDMTMTDGGCSLDEYGHIVFEDALFEGFLGTLVDNDPRSFPDVASRRAAGARPRAIKLMRQNLVALIISVSDKGVHRLIAMSFIQPIRKIDYSNPNAWIDETTPAIKVILAADPAAPRESEKRLVRTFTYVEIDGKDGKDWVEDTTQRHVIRPDRWPTDELLDIPFVPHYGNRKGPWRGECPFLSTAYTEANIFCHNSELSAAAREASITFVHRSGVSFETDPLTNKAVIPDTMNARFMASQDPQAHAELLESEGKAIDAIIKVIDFKTKHIERSHHRIASERPTGPATATEISVDAVQASSRLEMWVITHEGGWKRILDLFALLGGHPKRGTVSIPHDFGLPNAFTEMNNALFAQRLLSPDNFFPIGLNVGQFDEETFSLEKELAWHKAQTALGT